MRAPTVDAPASIRRASGEKKSELSASERRTLRLLSGRSATFVDGRWRLRGAPAPKLDSFALSTLLEARLVQHIAPRSVILSAAGRLKAEEPIDWSLPPRLARLSG